MSDLCENIVTITGSARALREFHADARSDKSPIDFDRICPAQDWDIHWHAISAMENHRLKKNGDFEALAYEFDTELEPPIALFCCVAKANPTLAFRLEYDHPIQGFKGVATFRKGKVDDRRERWSADGGVVREDSQAYARIETDLDDAWVDHVHEELQEESEYRDR